jgi:hypothetical protein
VNVVVVKVEPTWADKSVWQVCDQKRTVKQFVRPQSLPQRVREAVQIAGRAYFHATPTGGSVEFGPRVVGDPNWK